MSQQTATKEPTRVFNGDSLKWKRSFGDYPSSSYTLYYRLVGEANQTITAAADGNGYLVTVTSTDSFAWLPGNYRLIGYVSDGSDERITVYEGNLEVLFDPATAPDETETRTFWRRTYDHLQDIIEGKAQQGDSSYTIAGRSVSRMTWDEVISAYDRAAEMVQTEEAQDKARRGEATLNNIGIRFGRP